VPTREYGIVRYLIRSFRAPKDPPGVPSPGSSQTCHRPCGGLARARSGYVHTCRDLVQVLLQDDEDESTVHAYQSLIELRNTIFDDPTQDLDEWARKLRQANFKQQYKMRQNPNDGFDF
jgi:hypothetical protein